MSNGFLFIITSLYSGTYFHARLHISLQVRIRHSNIPLFLIRFTSQEPVTALDGGFYYLFNGFSVQENVFVIRI